MAARVRAALPRPEANLEIRVWQGPPAESLVKGIASPIKYVKQQIQSEK